MGDLNVSLIRNTQEMQTFMRHLLKDTQAMEHMLREEWFETDPIRIGAEQEMALVDKYWKPKHINLQALEAINDPGFTSELANFNLEANLDPLPFSGNSISQMHQNLKETMDRAHEVLKGMDAHIVLAGILPSIRKFDVEIANITPLDRYRALMDGLKELRGNLFELRINGIDELNMQQETAMLEACNTSFQVHLQVRPNEFVSKYNFAQALAGPVMAIAVNSPMLFGRRLWKETRIALFQQSIDIRTFTEHLRDRSPRVIFGNDWLKDSVMEIYREDVARFKPILKADVDEDVSAKLRDGIAPKLRALNIHNSTVYRWNRPCYGISPNGKPHLRIENRIFPAGPSLPDTMANAALWLGLMNGIEDEVGDISKLMDFSDAKANFFAAARFGLDTKLTWVDGKKISPATLIREQLIPIARHGLEKAKIDSKDIDYYLDIIGERARTTQTGSSWMLSSFSKLQREGLTRDEIGTALTATISENQVDGRPVHEWELASVDKILEYEPSSLLVEEFMHTDLITVQEDDILDLAAQLMDWRRIRHVAVENKKGNLVGLLTQRILLRYFANRSLTDSAAPIETVSSIMLKNPMTISPDETIGKAMELMRSKEISCLPVLKGKELVGIITEAEFMAISSNLIKRLTMRQQ